MSSDAMPWYVRWIIGVGAWITAIVLAALGCAIVYLMFEADSVIAIAIVGAVYLPPGMILVNKSDSGVFAEQFGVALTAAGALLITIGIALEAKEIWAGVPVAALLAAGVTAKSENKTLQFLLSAGAATMLLIALIEQRTPWLLDIAALATPAGLYLWLRPPQRDLAPLAIVLLLVFPLLSVIAANESRLLRHVEIGGMIARSLHILLFLILAYVHAEQPGRSREHLPMIAFAVVATLICLILPPGGAAAMFILMLAFVIGSKPFALLGAALQVQFISRYYYSLEMNLFDKSILLMAVGTLLLALWWGLQKRGRSGATA